MLKTIWSLRKCSDLLNSWIKETDWQITIQQRAPTIKEPKKLKANLFKLCSHWASTMKIYNVRSPVYNSSTILNWRAWNLTFSLPLPAKSNKRLRVFSPCFSKVIKNLRCRHSPFKMLKTTLTANSLSSRLTQYRILVLSRRPHACWTSSQIGPSSSTSKIRTALHNLIRGAKGHLCRNRSNPKNI